MDRLSKILSKLAFSYQMPQSFRSSMVREISCKCQKLCTKNVQVFDRPMDGFNKCLYHCVQAHGIITTDTSYLEGACD